MWVYLGPRGHRWEGQLRVFFREKGRSIFGVDKKLVAKNSDSGVGLFGSFWILVFFAGGNWKSLKIQHLLLKNGVDTNSVASYILSMGGCRLIESVFNL